MKAETNQSIPKAITKENLKLLEQFYSNQVSLPRQSLPKVDSNQLKIQSKTQIATKKNSIIFERRSSLANKSSLSNKEESSFMSKYEWVHEGVDYNLLNEEQIKCENKRLKKALRYVNQQVDKVLNKLQPVIEKSINKILLINNRNRIKTQAVYLLSDAEPINHRLQVQAKQAVNNERTLKMYREQFNKLKMRERLITSTQLPCITQSNQKSMPNTDIKYKRKQRLQTSIDETIKSLQKDKKYIKQLQYRSKTIEKHMDSTDQIIQDMRRLERQLQFQRKRRNNLAANLKQVENNIQTLGLKLQTIQEKHKSSQNYFRQNSKSQKSKIQIKSMEQQLKTKQHSLQLMRKNKQLFVQSKQVNYHKLLKLLQTNVEGIEKTNIKINQTQLKNIALKNEIAELQKRRSSKQGGQKLNKFNEQINGNTNTLQQILSQINNDDNDLLAPFKQDEYEESIQKSKAQNIKDELINSRLEEVKINLSEVRLSNKKSTINTTTTNLPSLNQPKESERKQQKAINKYDVSTSPIQIDQIDQAQIRQNNKNYFKGQNEKSTEVQLQKKLWQKVQIQQYPPNSLNNKAKARQSNYMERV